MQKLKPTVGLEVKAFVVQTMYLLYFELIRYIATVKTNQWFGIEAFFCLNNEFVSFLIYWIYCDYEQLELILCKKWKFQVNSRYNCNQIIYVCSGISVKKSCQIISNIERVM